MCLDCSVDGPVFNIRSSRLLQLVVVNSDAGHDGFLLEQEEVSKNVIRFLESIE